MNKKADDFILNYFDDEFSDSTVEEVSDTGEERRYDC